MLCAASRLRRCKCFADALSSRTLCVYFFWLTSQTHFLAGLRWLLTGYRTINSVRTRRGEAELGYGLGLYSIASTSNIHRITDLYSNRITSTMHHHLITTVQPDQTW